MRSAESSYRTWLFAALDGARTGIYLTFAYAFFFAVYAILRSSLSIQAALKSNDVFGILAANGITLAYLIIVFASIMSFASAFIGAVTAVIIKWLLTLMNPRSSCNAVLVGLITSICFCLLIYFVLQTLLGSRLSLEYPDAYMFWFGIPTAVFICASGAISWKLNSLLFVR